MAGERDQQHLGAEVGQDLHALEAEPLVAFDVVPDPACGLCFQWTREVAGAVAQARVERGVELAPEDVDLGLGKVGQAAGVVGVEVGGDDLRARRPAAKPSASTCFSAVSPISACGRISAKTGPSRPGSRMSSTPKPVSSRTRPSSVSISRQWQTTPAALEQAALAVDQPRPVGAQRAAVEVVDAHAAA